MTRYKCRNCEDVYEKNYRYEQRRRSLYCGYCSQQCVEEKADKYLEYQRPIEYIDYKYLQYRILKINDEIGDIEV